MCTHTHTKKAARQCQKKEEQSLPGHFDTFPEELNIVIALTKAVSKWVLVTFSI